MPKHYFFLVIAIISEVIGTAALPASAQFTKLWPSVLVVVGYGTAFYFLSLTLTTLSVGVTYATWSGLGIVLITIAGVFLYNQKIDFWAAIGMGLIIAGVAVIHLLSKTATH